MKKNRNVTIDIAKGIGIILIIIGHCVYFGKPIHNWIFSFHVPLFFIISGLFFKESDITVFLSKKGKQLLVPYLGFCLIGFVLTLLIPSWREKLTIIGLLRDLFLAWPDYINVSSVWFLVCLFVTMFMLNVILLIKREKPTLSYTLFGIVVLFGFLFGQYCRSFSFISVVRMPLNIDCACVALLFLGMGYFFKNSIIHAISLAEKKSILWQFFVLLITCTLSFFLTKFNGRVNLHGLSYNNWILYILSAINGFILVFALSLLFSKINLVKKLFSWCGENSMVIMGVQAIVVRIFLLFVNKITGNAFELYYVPEKYAISGSLFSVIVTLVIVSFYNIISKNLVNKFSGKNINEVI